MLILALSVFNSASWSTLLLLSHLCNPWNWQVLPSEDSNLNKMHINITKFMYEGGSESSDLHAREPMYSNSAVIADGLRSKRAQTLLFWFAVIHSMRKFTTINFHDDFFFILNCQLGIVVHSGSIGVFTF